MKSVDIIDFKNNEVICACRLASNLFDLTFGMLLDKGEEAPLILPQTSLIHTFGMRFPIDLYFFDRNWVCVGIVKMVEKNRFVIGPKDCRNVLETICGLERVEDLIQVGTRVKVITHPLKGQEQSVRE